jgi:hypothetical protein
MMHKKRILTVTLFMLMVVPIQDLAHGNASVEESIKILESGNVIMVPSPGEHRDIQPSLQAAVDTASPGDIVLLPAGEFYLDGRVIIDKFINIRGRGYQEGGTKLYRREEISDDQLNSWGTMLQFRCNSDEPSHIVLSDIHFKGKNPSLIPGDGGSTVNDYGVQFRYCVDFVVARNKFEHFGFAAVYVLHRDTLSRGLVAENEFFQNLNIEPDSDGFNLGYGVVIYGEDETWIPDPQFGSENFIFIEDNIFIEHRHSVACGGTGRYVFRKNRVIDNLVSSAVDAHGGGMWGNTLSSRAFEVYENDIHNTRFEDGTPINPSSPNGSCSDLAYFAIHFRGGEGVVYNNRIEGFRYGVSITTEITGAYPVITQIGYKSALELGPSHSGIEPPASDGDIFIWGNEYIPYDEISCNQPFRNFREDLLKEGRDYHLEIPKPNYSPYTYPHPLLELIPGPLTTFVDVPLEHWAHDYIEILYQDGYIAGCNVDPMLYCPEDILTRAESAVFVERGIHGADYLPLQPTDQVFVDVPLAEWFAKWANALWDDGFTTGCGTDPLIYCPFQENTRAEGSVFFLRMMYGADYVPPEPTGLFADVPTTAWYADWAEAAYNAGIIPACQTEPEKFFCPWDPLDRAMAAYMMVQAKGIQVSH